MNTLAEYVKDGGNSYGKTFKLTADLDFSQETNYTTIGTYDNKFSGTFDGDGHTIRNINCSVDSDYVGLFGATEGATISNVNLDKCTFQRIPVFVS